RISSQREGEYDLRHGASWANDEYPWAMVTGLKMQREISWKRCLERFADALRTGCRTALPSRPAFQDGSGEPSYGAYATPRRTALNQGRKGTVKLMIEPNRVEAMLLRYEELQAQQTPASPEELCQD